MDGITYFISCMGLFFLYSIMAELYRIRKTLGVLAIVQMSNVPKEKEQEVANAVKELAS